MSDTTRVVAENASWNVLTSAWLDVMTLKAEPKVLSPLEALGHAGRIRCIAAASPLDLFAAHRFLLALLYWKAGVVGGVSDLRALLLQGDLPESVLEAVEKEADCFDLFSDDKPFLQDTTLRNAVAKKSEQKSVGSFFAEFASGTNIAHFHHGDDENMRLCVRCVTIGLLRVIPWSQAGGSGITPSVHNAPPIAAIAMGATLAMSLGLNLVRIPAPVGSANWTGRFRPTEPTAAIPYLEAFTWNPRRIHLGSPLPASVCWGCGRRDLPTLGPIVYKKNENTKKRPGGGPFEWKDPAAFYGAELYCNPRSRAAVVRRMYEKRFGQPLEPGLTLEQIRGREGYREVFQKAVAGSRGGACLQAWSSPGEQGFAVRTDGDGSRKVVDFEGLHLVSIPRANN
jgi:hypothetical protein